MVAISNEGKNLCDQYSKKNLTNLFVNLFSSKTKTSSQEKMALPNTNRCTSPITAFRRKKKTPSHTNDPG